MLPFKDILLATIPPQDKDPKVTIFRWLMWVTVMGLVGFTIAQHGSLASAGELDKLSQEVLEIKKSTLEQQIFDKSIEVCQSSGQLRTAYTGELSRLISEWQKLTESSANPPTFRNCQELGVSPQ